MEVLLIEGLIDCFFVFVFRLSSVEDRSSVVTCLKA